MPSPIIPLVWTGTAGIGFSDQQGAVSLYVDKPNNRVASFTGIPSNGNATHFVVTDYTTGALISDTLVFGIQTTNSTATPAGNNTLHFSSLPGWVADGMTVEDSSNGNIPSGTTILSHTSTTVVMSNNTVSVGVVAFSTITFGNNFFPVSGNTRIYEKFPCSCMGQDGHVYVRTSTASGNTLTLDAAARISKIDIASHVEVVAVQPSGWGFAGDVFDFNMDTCSFKLGGVNYVAIAQVPSKVFIINADTMASVVSASGTGVSGVNGACLVIAGGISSSTQHLYVMTHDITTSPSTNKLFKVDFDSVGVTLTWTLVHTYTATDWAPGWSGNVHIANQIFDSSTGDFLLWVNNEDANSEWDAFIVRVAVSDGHIVWRVPVPQGGGQSEGLDWALGTLPKQSDLSQGSFGYTVVTSQIGTKYGPDGPQPISYMDSPWQAIYIEITTATGAYVTKNDDHLYQRGQEPNYWDSVNRKLLYFDTYADSTATYTSGYTLFLPDNSFQSTPWTRSVISPWSNAGHTYDFLTALARDPRQPLEVFTWAYEASVGPSIAVTPHAIAVYDTSSGALNRASLVDGTQYGSQSLVNLAWGGSFSAIYTDNDPLIIAPESRKLFYFHVGETNPPSNFPTTRWMQMVDADSLIPIRASNTPAAASGIAPWIAGGSSMLSGPLTMCCSGSGTYCFATWYFDSGTNDVPFCLWQTSGTLTHYGTLNADVIGFDGSTYDFPSDNVTYGVFDGTGRLWMNVQDFLVGYDVLIVCTISGVVLTQQHIYTFDSSNHPHIFGLQYDPDANQIVVTYSNNLHGINSIRVNMDGTSGSSLTPFAPVAGQRPDTNAWFGAWINGSKMAWPQDILSQFGPPPDNVDSGFVIDLNSTSIGGVSGDIIWALHGLDTNATNVIDLIQYKASSNYTQGPKASDFGYYLANWPFYLPGSPASFLQAKATIQFKGRLSQPIPVPPPPNPIPPAPPNPFNCLVPVISQYANSPILLTILENFCEAVDPWPLINEFYNFLWNVNTAIGYGLDVWGRIVGVTRILEIAEGRFFGFEEQDGSTDPFNTSPFFGGALSGVSFSLSDDAFRLLILVKALANITDGSTKSINTILRTLFQGAGNAYVADNENMTMTYTFEFPLSPVQSAIINQSGVLPRSTGVATTVSVPI